MDIKVLGCGCAKCRKAEQVVRKAIAGTGVHATFEQVADRSEIAEYGVFATPAVVVDGEVRSLGEIPDLDAVKEWLKEAGVSEHARMGERLDSRPAGPD